MKKTIGMLLCGAGAFCADAADFHWTGNAGDHLWSSAGNWADSGGTPKGLAPADGVTYSYNFTGCPDGYVVTQDVNVATRLMSVNSSDKVNRRTLTWVSAPGKKFSIPGTGDLYVETNTRLVLDCDMSSDSNSGTLTKRNPGILAFRLQKANATWRSLIVQVNAQQNEGTVELLEGGATPLMAMTLSGAATVLNEHDGTVLAGLGVSPDDAGVRPIGRALTTGKSLTVGTNADADGADLLPVPVFASGGRLTVGSERTVEARSLTVGGTLELRRGDWRIADPPLTAIRWTFEDAADPLKDSVGSGWRMLTPLGLPELVEDEVRGQAIRLSNGRYFMGPDENAGLAGLKYQSASSPFTVAFWLRPDAVCDKNAKLLFWGVCENNRSVALRFNEGKGFMFTTWGDIKKFDTKASPFDGNWHHVAVTYNGDNNIIVYFDGEQALWQGAGAFNPPNQNFYIGSVYGGWVTDGSNPYTGLLDDVLVAGYHLGEEQIAELYERGLEAFVEVSSVAVDGSGTLSLPDRDVTIGRLSGTGLLGGIEQRGAGGRTLTVGAETVGSGEYGATLRGGDMTLRKEGDGYVQVLGGAAANVTNLFVASGTLKVRRPLARQGTVVCYSFDDADAPFRDSGLAGLPLEVATGSPTTVADGVSGRAVRFLGDAYLSSGLNFKPANFPSGNDSYTLSLWIRPTAATCVNMASLVSWGSAAQRELVNLCFQSATRLKFSDGADPLYADNLPNLADGSWHHLAVVYDSERQSLMIYVDGVCRADRIGTVAKQDVQPGKAFQLARGKVDGKTYAGDMDEVRISDCAWSSEEVASAFALRNPPAADENELLPQPIARWTFDDEEKPGRDVSGNGHDLEANGSVVTEAGGLVAGRAARFGGGKGYFSLSSVPDDFPAGSHAVSVVCRLLPDDVQPAYSTVLAWGDVAAAGNGKLIKIGTRTGREGPRVMVGKAVFEGDYSKFDYYRSSVGTERQRWLTLTVVYSPSEETSGGVVRLYLDGRPVDSSANTQLDIQAMGFALGASTAGDARYEGLVDEVRIYDCLLSDGQVRRISEQLGGLAADSRVLVRTPSVSVAEGAVLDICADEEVGTVSGAGRINVSALASLTVSGANAFSGTFAGGGALVFAAGAVLHVDDAAALPLADLKGTVSLGKDVVIVTGLRSEQTLTLLKAGRFENAENLSTWRVMRDGRRRPAEFSLSADGRTLSVHVGRPGLMILIK